MFIFILYTHRMMSLLLILFRVAGMSHLSEKFEATEVSTKGRGTGMSCWYLVTRFFHPNISRL